MSHHCALSSFFLLVCEAAAVTPLFRVTALLPFSTLFPMPFQKTPTAPLSESASPRPGTRPRHGAPATAALRGLRA